MYYSWFIPVVNMQFILVFLLCFYLTHVFAVELTFELPDNAKQCFHEDIRQGVKSTIEFQVNYHSFIYLIN